MTYSLVIMLSLGKSFALICNFAVDRAQFYLSFGKCHISLKWQLNSYYIPLIVKLMLQKRTDSIKIKKHYKKRTVTNEEKRSHSYCMRHQVPFPKQSEL